MYIGASADRFPERPALIFGEDGPVVSFGELDRRSTRAARFLRERGLRHGDTIAVLLANEERYFDFVWAALRSGLYVTPVNWHLSAEEIAYIVDDCDARVLVTSARFADLVAGIRPRLPKVEHWLCVGGALAGFETWESLSETIADERLTDEREGAAMMYSSGTTGRPKGVKPPLGLDPAGTGPAAAVAMGFAAMFGLADTDRYLSPGPLYHAAPLVFSTVQHRLGATAVVMERFDPEGALRIIEHHRVTTSQWVPTHFIRMLRLPADVRARYDLSTLRLAIHAAAPCPIPVKQAMIDWWGPKIVEYYGGTEGGGTLIRSEDWLTHKGSVGRHWLGGTVHILDDEGAEITEPGVDGGIYFEAPEDPAARFRYHKDDAKTAATFQGRLFTLGDVGHLDAEGFLYLTDRKSHMIISGGVNIYPQEVENCLATHDKVDDVAVIGVPHDEMGEEVKAVVALAPGLTPSPELAAELIAWTRDRIAHYKAPRTIDFVDTLPRQANGKIYKRILRDAYWKGRGWRIG